MRKIAAAHGEARQGEAHVDQKNNAPHLGLSRRWFIVPGINTAGVLPSIANI
jgi:hypothetical protein